MINSYIVLVRYKAIIFDLDQTLIDSSRLEAMRSARQWSKVLGSLNLINYHSSFSGLFTHFEALGVKIGVVTNSPRHYAEAVLKAYRIPYHVLVAYHDVTRRKPHPEPFLKALSLLKLPPEHCITIGDADHDMVASKAAGIRCIGAQWYTPGYTFQSHPDILISNLEDLIDHLN